MRGKDAIGQIDMVLRLREAELQLARYEQTSSRKAVIAAQAEEEVQTRERNAAVGLWQEFLMTEQIDPARLSTAKSWLLQQDRALKNAHLTTAIAVEREDTAIEEVARSRSRLESANVIRGRLARSYANHREEQQSAAVADLLLHRTGRW